VFSVQLSLAVITIPATDDGNVAECKSY